MFSSSLSSIRTAEDQKIVQWQRQHLNLHQTLPALVAHLLNKLDESLLRFSTRPKVTVEEIATRTAYIAELRQLTPEQYPSLITKIQSGKTQFSKDKWDLPFVLLREGENIIQQYHVINKLIYRREVYLNLIIALEKYRIDTAQGHQFLFETEGDPKAAYPYLMKAAQSSDDYLGSPEAQFELGRLFSLDVIPVQAKDGDYYKDALKYYALASERKHQKALAKIAKLYIKGQGVVRADFEMALFYLKQAIGYDVHLRESEALELVLFLADKNDVAAIKYLHEKLDYHQKFFFQEEKSWGDLIKADAAEFFRQASEFDDEGQLSSPVDQYKMAGIMHLCQIHFLADTATTMYKYRGEGYIFAKEILVKVYEQLIYIFENIKLNYDFISVIEQYSQAIQEQKEDKKDALKGSANCESLKSREVSHILPSSHLYQLFHHGSHGKPSTTDSNNNSPTP